MNGDLSVADVAAMANNDGFGGTGGWLWFLIVIFAIFGGGFGFGNNATQYATSAEVQRGFDNQNVMQRFSELQTAQATNAKENAILIQNAMYQNSKDFADNTMATVNAANSIVSNQATGFAGVNAAITDVGYQLQNLACGINRNIDSVKYEAAQNTCAITNAIHQEGELTRGLMQANTIQNLRDRLEEKDRLYQAANFQISQQAQTSNILDSLGRWVSNPPVPYSTQFYNTAGTTY